MADNKFNDENLSKLSEEYSNNTKKKLSNFNRDEFDEFFGNKKKDKSAAASATPQSLKNPDYSLESDDLDEDEGGLCHRPAHSAPPRKTGVLSGFMYFMFIVSISIILACVGWIAACDVLALNKEVVTAEVTLPHDIFTKETKTVENEDGTTKTVSYNKADMGEVAKILKKSGIIEYKSLFLLYSSVSHANTKLDPGNYELSTIYDYRAIVKKMQFGSGAMTTTEITFPEGLTLQEVFKLLEENKVCTVEELTECAKTMDFGYSFLENLEYGSAARLEGYLFPDTYQFFQGGSAQPVIDKFLHLFNSKVTTEMRERATSLGYSLHDIIKIASMIEEEAANDQERATIASVIYNRLNQGMPLQVDATVQYALEERKEHLTIEDTQIDSPYNTYLNTGLPAGPIANPGQASINAALNPSSTNYLYYALDEATGTHRFFTNSSEFEAFKATQSYGQ